MLNPCDLTFDVLWRNGSGDHALASFTHHFDPPATGFNAVPYEADAPGVAAAAKSNDLLVLRFTAQGAMGPLLYIPNSDGANAQGRIPSVTLPR